MPRRVLIVSLITSTMALAPATAAGQAMTTVRSGPRAILPRADEIALARSAAPRAVSDSATVWVFGRDGYEIAAPGTSGAVCYVSRGWVDALEPHCFDREGAETIFPMEKFRVELLHQGRTWEEADRAIAEGLFSGRFRLPRRPAMSYMMSAEQKLVAPNGQVTGAYRPFILLYYPYLTDAEIGMTGTRRPGEPGIGNAGGPTAALTVFVPSPIAVRR